MAAMTGWTSAGHVGNVAPASREKKLDTGLAVLMQSRLALPVFALEVVSVDVEEGGPASIDEVLAELQTLVK